MKKKICVCEQSPSGGRWIGTGSTEEEVREYCRRRYGPAEWTRVWDLNGYIEECELTHSDTKEEILKRIPHFFADHILGIMWDSQEMEEAALNVRVEEIERRIGVIPEPYEIDEEEIAKSVADEWAKRIKKGGASK